MESTQQSNQHSPNVAVQNGVNQVHVVGSKLDLIREASQRFPDQFPFRERTMFEHEDFGKPFNVRNSSNFEIENLFQLAYTAASRHLFVFAFCRSDKKDVYVCSILLLFKYLIRMIGNVATRNRFLIFFFLVHTRLA